MKRFLAVVFAIVCFQSSGFGQLAAQNPYFRPTRNTSISQTPDTIKVFSQPSTYPVLPSNINSSGYVKIRKNTGEIISAINVVIRWELYKRNTEAPYDWEATPFAVGESPPTPGSCLGMGFIGDSDPNSTGGWHTASWPHVSSLVPSTIGPGNASYAGPYGGHWTHDVMWMYIPNRPAPPASDRKLKVFVRAYYTKTLVAGGGPVPTYLDLQAEGEPIIRGLWDIESGWIECPTGNGGPGGP